MKGLNSETKSDKLNNVFTILYYRKDVCYSKKVNLSKNKSRTEGLGK